MIPKLTTGQSFRGVLDYILDTGGVNHKEVEFIGGSVSGDTVETIMSDFAKVNQVVARKRRRVTKPVVHISLSFAPEDGRLDSLTLMDIAEHLLLGIGLDPYADFPFCVVRHSETGLDHIHIVFSKVSLSGEVWNDSFSAKRAIQACREIEDTFRLTAVCSSKTVPKATLDKLEKTMTKAALAAGKPLPFTKLALQNEIDDILNNSPMPVDVLYFIRQLKGRGVSVKVNLASTGRLNGFSFKVGNRAFKGSELGRDYSWSGLQKRGLKYGLKDADRLRQGGYSRKAKPVKVPLPLDQVIRNVIDDELIKGRITADIFVRNLRNRGIDVKASISHSTYKLSGFSFSLGGLTAAGSKLGFEYAWQSLQRRCLLYKQGPDSYKKLKEALAVPLGRFHETKNNEDEEDRPGFRPDSGGSSSWTRQDILAYLLPSVE